MYFTKTREVKNPSKGTPGSAGFDFFVPNDHPSIIINPGQSVNIPSGIKVLIPNGYAGIFFNKSSVGSKGVIVGACVVDSDYRGEVHLNVHNVSDRSVKFDPGQKLVQMILIPVHPSNATMVTEETYKSFGSTSRGSGGFGSTGV